MSGRDSRVSKIIDVGENGKQSQCLCNVVLLHSTAADVSSKHSKHRYLKHTKQTEMFFACKKNK